MSAREDHPQTVGAALQPPVAVPMVTSPPHPCPYLPGRIATMRAFGAGRISGEAYRAFMDAGFRRSGRVIYQPVCDGCRACVPLRVPVKQFRPNKSQRRCWRRNQDLIVTHAAPQPTDEKQELYRRYLTDWHGRPQDADADSFREFLYDSPLPSLEFEYRDSAGRLLASGICDLCGSALSSVYFYFDPAQRRRGLGTFSALYEIDFARRRGLDCCYLGFSIVGCAAMEYKRQYRPHELLGADGQWHEEPRPPIHVCTDIHQQVDADPAGGGP